MAPTNDGKSGGEFGLRRRPRNALLRNGPPGDIRLRPNLRAGLLVAGVFLGYGMFHRGEDPNQGKPEATVGSTR